jgi:hypothetical protein
MKPTLPRIATLFSSITLVFLLTVNAFTADHLTVVDPATNLWRVQSSDGKEGYSAIKWGLKGDVQVPADYDGDGIKDVAVWRPSNGIWYILRSRDGLVSRVQWGQTTWAPSGRIQDIPVPADYDGDGVDDLAVWRPVDGRWYMLKSTNGFSPAKAFAFLLGSKGDTPVPADYDGDGVTDAAVFRATENRWYILQSKAGILDVHNFCSAGNDRFVPADYTGDGRADLAVFRAGLWIVQDIANDDVEQFEFGFADSQPVPGDYDGDGTADYAVYRQGTWYFYDSGTPRFRTLTFGQEGDVPLTSPGVVAAR